MAQSSTFNETLSKYIEWKIPKFSAIDAEPLRCPDFSLPGTREKWFMWISFYPSIGFGTSPQPITLRLCRDISTVGQRVFFRVGIKRVDGSVFKVVEINKILKMHSNTLDIKIAMPCELQFARDVVASDGAFTIFCIAAIMNEPLVSSAEAAEISVSITEAQNNASQIPSSLTTVETASQTTSSSGISTLIENFKDLYISKCCADVKIKVKGRELLAHRSVLSARSTVFASMFNSDMAEKNSGVVKITDCDPDSFDNFLLFLYTGQLDIVSSSNATTLYEISDKYDLKELKEECIRCMINELTVDSLCDVFQMAVTYNDADILKASTNFFLENAKRILVTIKWQKFSEQNHTLANELFLKYVSKYTKE